MQAAAERSSRAFSRVTNVVCFLLPAMLFGVMLGTFALLYVGALTAPQYFEMLLVVIAVAFCTCIAVLMTVGDQLVRDIFGSQRQLSVLLYFATLMMLSFLLPSLFGFTYY